MADYRDLTGDYEKDFGILKEMLHSLTSEIHMDNMRGQIIEHTFVGTDPEAIDHGLDKTPTLWKILDTIVAGTVYRSEWGANSITLVSSDATQVLRFYVE